MPRGENVHQSIESMNEKAPEEAERGSALRMSSPWKKVAAGVEGRTGAGRIIDARARAPKGRDTRPAPPAAPEEVSS